jgi:hypothetical protein
MCSGKVVYPSRRVANGVRRVMLAKRISQETLHAYKCHCGSWHLGNTGVRRDLPQAVKTIVVAATEALDIVWRHADGSEQRERHTAPARIEG